MDIVDFDKLHEEHVRAGISQVVQSGDIVDVTEIASRAGTTPGTVHSWRVRHPDFPTPLKTLAIGPIWDWPRIEKWLAKRRK